MKRYKVKIEPDALADIQDITNWYNEAGKELGKRFQNTAVKQINSLNQNPHIYAIRYNEIRCMVVNKFPYLVHFYINDECNTVEVLAVISTDRNPKIWEEKIGKRL
jgi:plasmid stabilization system protein ParE